MVQIFGANSKIIVGILCMYYWKINAEEDLSDSESDSRYMQEFRHKKPIQYPRYEENLLRDRSVDKSNDENDDKKRPEHKNHKSPKKHHEYKKSKKDLVFESNKKLDVSIDRKKMNKNEDKKKKSSESGDTNSDKVDNLPYVHSGDKQDTEEDTIILTLHDDNKPKPKLQIQETTQNIDEHNDRTNLNDNHHRKHFYDKKNKGKTHQYSIVSKDFDTVTKGEFQEYRDKNALLNKTKTHVAKDMTSKSYHDNDWELKEVQNQYTKSLIIEIPHNKRAHVGRDHTISDKNSNYETSSEEIQNKDHKVNKKHGMDKNKNHGADKHHNSDNKHGIDKKHNIHKKNGMNKHDKKMLNDSKSKFYKNNINYDADNNRGKNTIKKSDKYKDRHIDKHLSKYKYATTKKNQTMKKHQSIDKHARENHHSKEKHQSKDLYTIMPHSTDNYNSLYKNLSIDKDHSTVVDQSVDEDNSKDRNHSMEKLNSLDNNQNVDKDDKNKNTNKGDKWIDNKKDKAMRMPLKQQESEKIEPKINDQVSDINILRSTKSLPLSAEHEEKKEEKKSLYVKQSKYLRAHCLAMQLKQLQQSLFKTRFPEANFTIEKMGRTAEYNDILLLKITELKSAKDTCFRTESKFVDEVPEKKIIFIVHGLSVMGMSYVKCLNYIPDMMLLMSYYLQHLNKFDIFIMPMANPDGFTAAVTKQSLLWNKNMSPQETCSGVALDRNFDVAWNGSRNVTSCSQLYPGPSPFSEIETKVVRDVFHYYGHKIIAYIHVHAGTFDHTSFKGDAILYPKGYTDSQTNDDRYIDLRAEIEEAMRNASFQVMSVTVDTIRNWYGKVSGTSVDYASTVFGIPYALEYVMQVYDENAEEAYQQLALIEIWSRIVDTTFKNIWRNRNRDIEMEK